MATGNTVHRAERRSTQRSRATRLRSDTNLNRERVGTRTAAALIAGLGITYVIAHVLLLSRFPWFVDETIFAQWAQIAEGDRNQRFLALGIDHKGLLNSWIAAALIHAGAAPMVAMRLISLASGLVVGAATGLLVRNWRGPREGLMAGALALFVPYLFVHGAVGVHDEFIAAGSMVALFLQIRIAQRPRLDHALLLGITFGMLLLSKVTGAIAIALLPLSLAVFDWRSEGLAARLAAWAGAIGLALFIAAAMYALIFLHPAAYTPAPDNHRTLSDLLSDPFANVSTVAPGIFAAVVGYMTPAVLAAALWGAARAVISRDMIGLVVIAWVIAPLLAYFLLTDHAYPRYGLQMAAPLCALAVVGGVDLWRRIERRWSSRAAWVVTALGLAQLLVFDLWVVLDPQRAPYPGLDRDQYVTLVSNRQSAREAAQLILKRAPDQFTPTTPARERIVMMYGGWDYAAELVLNGRKFATAPRFITVIEPGQKEANQARYVILEGPVPAGLKVDAADVVKVWHRPDGGPTTTLYDRGQ